MLTDAPPRKTSGAKFLPSDRMKTLDLPQDRTLLAIAKSIESGMKSGSTADVRRPCAEFLDFASAFYEVPSCSLRVLAARALRGRENWASELFGDDAEFLDAFEASLTNKERREFGLPCVNRQKKDRAADYDNRLPDLMAFVQRYYFNHCKNDAKMALQLWQEDVEVITARMTELVNSKKRGEKDPFVKKDRKPLSADAIYRRGLNLERAQAALDNKCYNESRCPASSSEGIPF